jgi:hypothetical protein
MVGSFSIGDRVRYLPPWPSGLRCVVLIDCLGPAPAEATIVGNELRLDDTNTS